MQLRIKVIDWDCLYTEDEIECSMGQCSQISSLLYRSNITPELNDEINRNYLTYTEKQAQDIIDYLKVNQVDMIDAGFNYGQSYIKWKLKQY